MKGTFKLAAIIGLVAIQFSGVAFAAGGSTLYSYKFDKTASPWVAGAESAKYIDKGTLTHRIDYQTGPSLVPNGYVDLTNRVADAVWMQVPAKNPGDMVDLDFDARSDQACERCALLVYVGNEAPTSPWQFQKLDGPLTKTWEHHRISFGIKGDVVVAIGIMNLDFGPELKQVAGIDNVTIFTHDMTN